MSDLRTLLSFWLVLIVLIGMRYSARVLVVVVASYRTDYMDIEHKRRALSDRGNTITRRSLLFIYFLYYLLISRA